MKDQTAAADEARRVARQEATTSTVEKDVNADIAEHAERGDAV